MVYASVLAIIVIIAFFLYVGQLFLFDIIELLLNGAVLVAIGLRSNVEIRKEKKTHPYLVGAIIAAIFLLAFGNPFSFGSFPMWWITSFAIITFLFAQIILLYEATKKK